MKPAPSLRQLRYLVAVIREGHFGRAAETCFVTQSTLSAGIKEMETVLGTALIERSNRSVTITPLGRDIAGRAQSILCDVDDLVDAVRGAAEPLSGPLRLGVIPTIGPFLLPRVLPALRAAHPALELYLREDLTAPLVERLAAGDLDALLLAFPWPGADLATSVFADDPFWVAFPRGHGFSGREHIDAAALAGEKLLLLEEGHCLRDHALAACDGAAASRAGDFQATSLHTLVQMVDNGLGLTLLPKMAIDAGIVRGTGLAVRPVAGRAVARQIGLAWRRTSSRARDFALLGDFFRDELATPLTPPRTS